MTALESLLTNPVVQRVGWSLLHFLWQGVAVAVILAGAMLLLRRRSSNLRYVVACSALMLMLLLPAGTMWLVRPSGFEQVGRANQPAEFVDSGPVHRPYEIEPAAPANRDVAIVAAPAPPEALPAPVASAAPAESAENPLPWHVRIGDAARPALPWVVCGWLIGVLALSAWHVQGWVQVRRLRRLGLRPVGRGITDLLARLCNRLGVGRAVRAVESTLVRVPTVVGWFKPIILLPASALTGLTAEQLEAVLAHELAHIRRNDYLVNLLQTAAETLLFYHPAVWWVSARIRAERENCCDDLAVAACGRPLVYARALAAVAKLSMPQPRLAVAADGGKLFTRIRRIVGLPADQTNRRGAWLAGAFTLLTILAITIALGVASAADKPPAATDNDEPAATQPAKRNNVAEGGFVLSKPIEVRAEVKNARAKTLKFEKRDVNLVATLNLDVLSWPKQQYVARLDLLSETGTVLAGKEQSFESSGVVFGTAGWGRQELAFSFGLWERLTKATRFRLALRADAAPATQPVKSGSEGAMSPLHEAAAGGHGQTVEVLISGGSDPNVRDAQGRTPLHLAARFGHEDVAGRLLRNGADINAADNQGRTPLHEAAAAGHPRLVKFLLAHKAKTTQPATQPGGQVVKEVPPGLEADRDKLLAEADAKIRKGIIQLAEKFPHLKKGGEYWRSINIPSQPGRISILLYNTDRGKVATTREPMPDQQRVSILIVVGKPPSEAHQMAMFPLYPNLGLVGQVGVRAGNEELDTALKKLVADALAPLKRLNEKVGRANPTPTGASSKRTSTQPATQPGRDVFYQGRVVDLAGKPVLGASVVLVANESWITVRNGRPKENDRNVTLTTDAGGNVTFPMPADPFMVVVLHDGGFAVRTHQQLTAAKTISIEPWGQVAGSFEITGEPRANRLIGVSIDNPHNRSKPPVYFEHQVRSDEQGRFSFPRVRLGKGIVGERIELPGGAWPSTHTVPVEVKAGHTTSVTIGGKGAAVTGQVVLPDQHDRQTNWKYGYGGLSLKEDAQRYYSFPIDKDGSFRVADVMPGVYTLRIGLHAPPRQEHENYGPKIWQTRREITIKEPFGEGVSKTFDIGIVQLKFLEQYSATQPGAEARLTLAKAQLQVEKDHLVRLRQLVSAGRATASELQEQELKVLQAKVRLAELEGIPATQPATQPSQGATLTRVYDIRDLIRLMPPHVEPEGLGWPKQKPQPKVKDKEPAPTEVELTEQVMDLIKETVAPDSWMPKGKIGSMKFLGGQLIITQAPRHHKQILDLFKQLREGRGLIVQVESRFIDVSSATDKQLTEWLTKQTRATFKKDKWDSFLSDDDVKVFIKELQKSKDVRLLTAPRITIFNGQRAFVAVTHENKIKLPLLDAQGKTAEIPYLTGTLFDVKATVSADRRYVTSTCISESAWISQQAGKFETSRAKATATTSVPDGRTVLLRLPFVRHRPTGFRQVRDPDTGKTFSEVVEEPIPGQPQRYVYVLIKPKIIIQTEREEKTPRGDSGF